MYPHVGSDFILGADHSSPTSANSVADSYQLAAGESRVVTLRISLSGSLENGRNNQVGLSFVSDDQVRSDTTIRNRSLGDSNIEKRWFPETGPHDGVVYGGFLNMEIGS